MTRVAAGKVRRAFIEDRAATIPAIVGHLDGTTLHLTQLDGTPVTVQVAESEADAMATVLDEPSATTIGGGRLAPLQPHHPARTRADRPPTRRSTRHSDPVRGRRGDAR